MNTKKPRILIDIGKLKRSNNGLDTFIRAYISKLETLPQAKEFEITLLTPRKPIPNFSTKFPCISQRTLKHLQARTLAKKFDLWHSPFHTSNKVPKNHSCKHVVTIHDFNPVYEKPTRKAKYLKRSHSHILHSDHLVCISNFTKKELMKHHPSLSYIPCNVIYNGVEEATEGEKLDIKLPEKFLFSLGAFMKKKNYGSIIEMMPYINEDIDLIIAGSSNGTYIDQLKAQMHKLGIHNRIHFLTNITTSSKNYLLQNCEAFLFPSILEGFGLPPVEAMKHGKSVFIFEQTSLPEVLGNAGNIWENSSPQYMSKKVNHLIDSNQHKLPEIIQKNINHAAQFCWEKMTLAYLDVFSNLLKES